MIITILLVSYQTHMVIIINHLGLLLQKQDTIC